MAEAYALTANDVLLLQELLTAYKGGHLISRNNRRSNFGRPGFSPEMYLALPLTAIPAMSSTGTSTTDAQDAIPGSAECEVFQVVDNGDGPQVLYTGFNLTVYNNSPSDIAIGWIQIQRDKFGIWWAIPTVATSGQIILATGEDLGTGTINNDKIAIASEYVAMTNIATGARVTAFLRKGLIYLNGGGPYVLAEIADVSQAQYEVIDPELEFMGYTNTDVVKGGQVNVQIWFGSPQTTWNTANYDLLVQDNYGDIDAGSLVRCRWIDGRTWEIVNAECSVTGTGTP